MCMLMRVNRTASALQIHGLVVPFCLSARLLYNYTMNSSVPFAQWSPFTQCGNLGEHVFVTHVSDQSFKGLGHSYANVGWGGGELLREKRGKLARYELK